MLGQTRSFLRDLWALTRPYWFSEERWIARGRRRDEPRPRLSHGGVQRVEQPLLQHAAEQGLPRVPAPVGALRGSGGRVHRDRRLSHLSPSAAADQMAPLAD